MSEKVEKLAEELANVIAKASREKLCEVILDSAIENFDLKQRLAEAKAELTKIKIKTNSLTQE